jgi:hypothetical protein
MCVIFMQRQSESQKSRNDEASSKGIYLQPIVGVRAKSGFDACMVPGL